LKVLEFYKKKYGEDHKKYATILNSYCITLEKLEEFEEAKEGF
jgi:hypothetical protein